MKTTARKRLVGLVAFAGLIALGTALWFAHAHDLLDPAYARVERLTHRSHDGMDMNMPGMNMGSMLMRAPGKPSEVPEHATVIIPGEVQQRIGVTVGSVDKAPLRMSVRTVGIVRPDETKVARVHLKTEGWVDRLLVNYTGQTVRKGDPLLAIYSPQFLATQQDYLTSLRTKRDSNEPSSLAESARQRLELWDVPPEAIKKLEQTRKAEKDLTLRSPLTGTVLELNVREQEYVTPQKELYVLADLSTVWVQAKVYEYELPHVELRQPATVTLPALPEQKFTGKVVFVQPTVEESTRTVQVRVELPNGKGLLKPGMFANVEIQHTMGDGLLVPTSAVIRTGERDIAYRVESQGKFVPVVVKVSAFKFGDRFHVLEGLKAGDKVVTSANFLIDSESRLRMGGGMMPGMPGMDMGNMKGMGMKGMEGMDHGKMKHGDRKPPANEGKVP